MTEEVFLLDQDRWFYLDPLREQARHHGVRLLGYCLMSYHVPLVAIPERSPEATGDPSPESGFCPRISCKFERRLRTVYGPSPVALRNDTRCPDERAPLAPTKSSYPDEMENSE